MVFRSPGMHVNFIPDSGQNAIGTGQEIDGAQVLRERSVLFATWREMVGQRRRW